MVGSNEYKGRLGILNAGWFSGGEITRPYLPGVTTPDLTAPPYFRPPRIIEKCIFFANFPLLLC